MSKKLIWLRCSCHECAPDGCDCEKCQRCNCEKCCPAGCYCDECWPTYRDAAFDAQNVVDAITEAMQERIKYTR
jgi:hypothetical protein